jgi:hypothetical protein
MLRADIYVVEFRFRAVSQMVAWARPDGAHSKRTYESEKRV